MSHNVTGILISFCSLSFFLSVFSLLFLSFRGGVQERGKNRTERKGGVESERRLKEEENDVWGNERKKKRKKK